MTRLFIHPHRSPPHRTELHAPEAKTYQSRSGALGAKGRATTHRASDPQAALALYLNHVDQLLLEGYVEQGPWRCYALGRKRRRVRLPSTRVLVLEQDGELSSRVMDSLQDSILAYDALITQWIDQGFVLAPWAEASADVPQRLSVELDEGGEPTCITLQHRGQPRGAQWRLRGQGQLEALHLYEEDSTTSPTCAWQAPAPMLARALAPLSDAQRWDRCFGELRSLSAQPPSRQAFLDVCMFLELASSLDSPRTVTQIIPYLSGALRAWPSSLRMAPWLWIVRLIRGALPIEALHVTSALSLTAAMSGHHLEDPLYTKLIRWLRAYPKDGPALEGVSMSFRSLVETALRQAMLAEPDASFHPTQWSYSDSILVESTYHIKAEDLPLILGSPLMRQLRVLDLSWDPPYEDPSTRRRDVLDGRGLTLGRVAQQLVTTQLEVLDLWGQCTSTRQQLGPRGRPQALASLRQLRLGGGHPLGDPAVLELRARTPALRELDLRPGYVFYGSFDDDEEAQDVDVPDLPSQRLMRWNVYSNEDLQVMRLSVAGLRKLCALPQLERLVTSHVEGAQDADFIPERLLVQQGSPYTVLDGPPIACWERCFVP